MNKNIKIKVILFLLTLTSILNAENHIIFNRLTCEYIENPLGIDIHTPLLGWVAESPQRGEVQTDYQIIVSDNLHDIQKNKGNIWDSGKVRSSQSNNIAYTGKKLRSSTRYYWKVRIYSGQSEPSGWSESNYFETAFLSLKDWDAQWIGDGSLPPKEEKDFYKNDPAPIFWKTCNIKQPIVSARLYISGLGYYEATINGKKAGDHVLDPGWTSFDQTVLYSTYDVTGLLNQGENEISILLGNGYYNPIPMRVFKPLREYLTIGRPKVKAQLLIEYKNGTKEMIPTDASWEVVSSPILRNNVYLGEHYDAREELNPNSMKEKSKNAVIVEGPKGKLTAQMQPAIKATLTLKPIRMTEVRHGVFLFDMGQNFAGVARLKVKGERGTKVTIRYGEDIYSDGSLNPMTSVAGQVKRVWDADRSAEGAPQTAWQEDSYILKGSPEYEIWQPRFTFHGFRYVEISGYPGRPTLESIEGVRLNADLNKVGEFSCSNELINRIENAIQWTFLSNVFSVQSDCPHREKFGYGGDIVATTDAFCYLYDMSNFHAKTVRDYRDSRRPSGAMTETAPYMGIADCGFGDGSGPIGWQLAFGHAQKKLYEYYGNKRIIAENYDIFKQQVDFLSRQADSHIMDESHCIGDHEALEFNFKPSSTETRYRSLTATAHYYEHVSLLAEFAQLLGKKKDYEKYNSLANDIKTVFIQHFYQPETGILGNNTQISQTFGLFYNLLPEGASDKVFNQLVNNIKRADNHILTGIFATPMVLNLLSEKGRNDLAYQLVTNREFPGWGYMMERGATTIWETWAYSDNVYSHNHPMFGTVNEWFYRSLLGIHATSPGFETIRISPKPTGDLTWAKGSYQSVKGKIVVDWKMESGKFTLNVSVPFGVKAEIHLPNTVNKEVTENGKKLTETEGIASIKQENENTILHIGSGSYSFRSI